MLITKISRQKRDGYFSVFIDSEYQFSLTDLTLSGSGLREGTTMTEDDLAHWRQVSAIGKALSAAYRYSAARARSRQEVVRYLVGKQFEAGEIEQVVARLEAEGLIGDAKFARDWVDLRTRTSPRGSRLLRQELGSKGVDKQTIELATATDREAEISSAKSLIVQKRLVQKYSGQEQKLIAFMMRRGYDYSVIVAALRDE
jgi:regulatory protein